jgi:hypothetical protein
MARRWTGLAAIAVALAVAAPAQAAASKRTCRVPSNGTVHAKSSLATVYSVNREPNTILRACLRRDGTRLQLRNTAEELDSIEVANVTLAGRYGGWTEVTRTRYRDSGASGWVYDLKKRKLRWVRGGPYRPGGDAPEVTDFALTESGRAAFIAREHRIEYPGADGGPSEARAVWAVDAGPIRALDEGLDIDLTSLDLDGFNATWTAGGQRRSAQLY